MIISLKTFLKMLNLIIIDDVYYNNKQYMLLSIQQQQQQQQQEKLLLTIIIIIIQLIFRIITLLLLNLKQQQQQQQQEHNLIVILIVYYILQQQQKQLLLLLQQLQLAFVVQYMDATDPQLQSLKSFRFYFKQTSSPLKGGTSIKAVDDNDYGIVQDINLDTNKNSIFNLNNNNKYKNQLLIFLGIKQKFHEIIKKLCRQTLQKSAAQVMALNKLNSRIFLE